jgi:thymidylate synthase
MKQYYDLVRDVLIRGTRKENRTGVDTISAFAHHYIIDLQEGFPLLTSKKINWRNIVIENLWFLGGNPSWNFLHKHGVHFWDDWDEGGGQLPEAYGEYWRWYPNYQWQGNERTDKYNQDYADVGFDQFAELLTRLKKSPNDRRLVLTNWNPPSAYNAKLPPCHLMAIFNVQYINNEPVLCCHMTQRSCDVALGVPFNIAGYAFLTHLVAHLTGLKVGCFSHTLVDAHIYTSKPDGSMAEYDHVPGLRRQIERTLYKLPSLQIDSGLKTLENLDSLILEGTTDQIMDAFKIQEYKHHPHINFKVAV